MRQFKVSIMCLAYNHEAYIGKCLESILNQTFEDWELFVLDDGSSDHTWEVIERYTKDSRIRAFRQENRGVMHLAANLNFLLEKTRGHVVALLAGDDYWPLDRLAIQAPVHAHRDNLILSYGRVAVFNEHGILREYPRPPKTGDFITSEVLSWLLTIRACIQPVSVMINAAAFKRIGGVQQYARYPVEDYPTFLKLLALPGQACYLDALLGYWRVSEQQITKMYAVEVPEAALYAALRHFDALPPYVKQEIGLSRSDILHAHYSRTLLPSYLSAMRHALLSKKQKEAIHYARKLIRHGTFKRKLQGICGLAAAPLGWNLEPIFSYGRVRPPSELAS
jgi:glycosyltransferase involved in cell wall biosynthesis